MFSIPVCAGCEKLIFNENIQALDRYWHPECFRCAACGQPIVADYNARRGRIYHPECYQEKFGPVCAICKTPLLGEFSVDMWGNQYCTRHKDELPTCSTCSRLVCDVITGGGVVYHDGRQVCNICRQSAVDKPSIARSTCKQVCAVLAAHGLEIGQIPLPKLVDQAELKRSLQNNHPENTTGLTLKCITTTNGRESGRDAEIMILHGLPADLFASTMAHELGHAWLFLYHFPPIPPVVEEGFCELMSYLWLSEQKNPQADVRIQEIRKNTDVVYGRGYRAALRAFKKYGFSDMTAIMRLERRFPV